MISLLHHLNKRKVEIDHLTHLKNNVCLLYWRPSKTQSKNDPVIYATNHDTTSTPFI